MYVYLLHAHAVCLHAQVSQFIYILNVMLRNGRKLSTEGPSEETSRISSSSVSSYDGRSSSVCSDLAVSEVIAPAPFLLSFPSYFPSFLLLTASAKPIHMTQSYHIDRIRLERYVGTSLTWSLWIFFSKAMWERR